MTPSIYTYAFHPDYFSRRSGMHRLAEYVGAAHVEYALRWQALQQQSWTLGTLLRKFGVWYSGSTWNATWPVLDEWRLARRVEGPGPAVVHFIYGEFTVPRWPWFFHRKGARVVATYHASSRRLPEVVGRVKDFSAADWITLVSQTQLPFFQERGYPADRLRVILHGVDTEYFRPAAARHPPAGRALRGLMVGVTERDHAFLSKVLKKLPPQVLELAVSTSPEQQSHYRQVPHCRILDKLPDEELLDAYQQADLLIMPMFDCTANNVILEAMACGTPVLTNRVGGIPEYVSPESSFILDDKQEDAWVATLRELARDRERVWSRRNPVRQWAERFRWPTVADSFKELYREMICLV